MGGRSCQTLDFYRHEKQTMSLKMTSCYRCDTTNCNSSADRMVFRAFRRQFQVSDYLLRAICPELSDVFVDAIVDRLALKGISPLVHDDVLYEPGKLTV